MNLIKLTMSITLLLLTQNAFAEDHTNPGWSSPSSTSEGDLIERIYYNANFTHVRLSAHNVNRSNCNGGASTASYFSLDINNTATYDQMYSMLLAAQLSGAKVRFWLSGCSGQGGKYPKITSIILDT